MKTSMLRKFSLLGVLAFGLLSIIATGGGGGGSEPAELPPIDFSDYYPLTKGTSRSYEVTVPGAGTESLTQVWTNGRTYNGQATVRSCESATEWTDEAYVNGQTLSYGFSDDTGAFISSDPPIVSGIDNWEAGKTVTTSANLNVGGMSVPFKVTVTYAARETVTVPAGTFADSVRLDYSVNDGLLTGSTWLALGVGVIKDSDSEGEVWILTGNETLAAAAPELTAIDPGAGAVDGGNLLTLQGRNFQSGAQITIANKLAASVLVNSADTASAFIPAGELGGADVAIVNPDCQVAIAEGQFDYRKVWTATSTANAPAARRGHSAVWTGTEMIVWGGDLGNVNETNTGGRLDPVSNTWLPMSTTGAPQARYDHTAVWTGTEMIVWGGAACCNPDVAPLGNGARYDPQADEWTPMSSTGAPSARFVHSAVWTGMEMIIWGGNPCSACADPGLADGAAYDPVKDTWRPLAVSNAPGPRGRHSAVWTGTEMIIWGGSSDATYLNTGGRYDPATDSWLPVTTTDAPSPRQQHAAVWSGTEMIIYGGGTDASSATFNNSAARYDPGSDSWQATASPPDVTATFPYARAVWTGDRMFEFGTGLLYAPAADTWTGAWTSGRPGAGQGYSILWNGDRVMVWGGVFAGPLGTGGLYDPAVDPGLFPAPLPSITSISPNSGPVAGGTNLTITGTDFRPEARVSIGGIPALGVTVVDGNTILASTPAGNPGYADVVVSLAEIPWWQTTATAGFSYTPFSFEGWIGGGQNGWQIGTAPDSGRPGDAQFSNPYGLAIDTSGNIFVADFNNNRVQKWDSAGNYMGWIGGGADGWQTGTAPMAGQGNGQFNGPAKVHVDAAGYLYIADYANHRVQKWDKNGNRLGWIGGGVDGWQTGNAPFSGGSGDRQFDGAFGLALDSGGNIYVADYQNHRVQKWDAAGSYVGWIGGGGDSWQTGTAPAAGTGNGSFKWPMDVVVDSAGNIYVADSENWRIQKWGSSGNRLGWIGGGVDGWQTAFAPASSGTAFGEFTKVYGISLDVAGNIYAANAWSHSVYKWNPAGNAIGWIGNGQYGWQTGEITGTYGTALGYFNNPEDVAIGPDGKLYIADSYNARIQKWKE